MSIQESAKGFIAQCQRVFQITHKPKRYEFEHIALSTAMGILVIGVVGYIVSMVATVLRHAA